MDCIRVNSKKNVGQTFFENVVKFLKVSENIRVYVLGSKKDFFSINFKLRHLALN